MASDEKDDTTPYVVLMNIEEQYSLMPKSIAVPNGWKLVKEGTRAECGAFSQRFLPSAASDVHGLLVDFQRDLPFTPSAAE